MIRLSGRLRSALIIGVQGIRARKLRTLLSMVSLFLGVLAVVVVQTGAETARHALLANLELNEGKDGTVKMYVGGDPKLVPLALETMRGRTDGVASVSTNAIIGEPGVLPVNPGAAPLDADFPPVYGGEGPDRGPVVRPAIVCDSRGCTEVFKTDPGEQPPPAGQAIELNLVALSGDIRPFRPFRPQAGQWLDFTSAPSLAPRLVINKAAAEGFHRYRVPAQLRIAGTVADTTPRIVGVVDDGGDQPTAYLRADELMNWLPRDTSGSAVFANGVQLTMAAPGTDGEHILRTRLAARGVDVAAFPAETVNSRKAIADELAITRWIFLGLAALVLLIGVAGMLNVGLATVGERVEEFALRRAVGTPRVMLAGIVLAETLLTGLFTAAVAIGVAVLALNIGLQRFGPSVAELQGVGFPWQAAVAGVLAGLAAGLLGGLIPALRAARIPIATVMRA